ncbi:MAG TPA: DUF6502 family protein [Steroidobacteraceae bacterium]|jgi:hypothetical protein|nr:DUF6502 family protein [Steroidobacteraceae bacterium]
MPDNVKTAWLMSLMRLLRPLVRIMLREGLTYSHFAAIAQMAFVESAAKDFVGKGMKSPASSVCELTGMSPNELNAVLAERERFDSSELLEMSNPSARVLHGWHNDRDYVGPYGFPVDLPFDGSPLSFSNLAARHSPGVSPHVVLKELRRVGAVAEVGTDIWKPLKQEYIEPSLSPENLNRMASLVESLLSTLENNTRGKGDGTALFERTMIVDAPLTAPQLAELHSYLKVVGGQFLQRVDTFAAVDLQEKVGTRQGELPDIRAGLQCFLYVEAQPDTTKLRDAIEFSELKH